MDYSEEPKGREWNNDSQVFLSHTLIYLLYLSEPNKAESGLYQQ